MPRGDLVCSSIGMSGAVVVRRMGSTVLGGAVNRAVTENRAKRATRASRDDLMGYPHSAFRYPKSACRVGNPLLRLPHSPLGTPGSKADSSFSASVRGRVRNHLFAS